MSVPTAPAKHGFRGERGAILPLATLLLVVLMGFAALGVDATHAFSETRQAQSTADAAALAAGLEFLADSSPDNTDLYNTVKAYTDTNWGAKAPTDGEWATCTDPSKPAEYIGLRDFSTTPSALITDCISIKQVAGEPALLRVKLPEYPMPTTFAQVLGFSSVDISAIATVEIEYDANARILPFSIAADAGAEECLATPPSGLLPNDPAPCGGPTQGNFGMIDSPFFGAGDPHFTEPVSCPSSTGFNQGAATHNIALGIDHIIRAMPPPQPSLGTSSGPPAPAGADTCAAAAASEIPYMLMTETGNTVTSGNPSIAHIGFLGDASQTSPTTAASTPGRLRQSSSVPDGGLITGLSDRLSFTTSAGTYTVDNVGLWEYLIDTPGDSDSNLCDRSTYDNEIPSGDPLEGRELTSRLEACLAWARVQSPPVQIFSDPTPTSDGITSSPRFAVVPRLNYLNGSQFGSKWWAILDLKPMYLQSSWYSCTNGNDNECLFLPEDFENDPAFDSTDRDDYSILFNPGEGNSRPCYLNNGGNCVTPNSNRFDLEGLSAYVLDWDWFPSGTEDQYGGNSTLEVFLHENE